MIHRANRKIKAGGKWYLPGDVVPEELAQAINPALLIASGVPVEEDAKPKPFDYRKCEHIHENARHCQRKALPDSPYCGNCLDKVSA